MNDMKKEKNEDQDSFFNQLRSTSTKRRTVEFLKKDIHDQIQELDYSLGRTKDRIKELGFERERIKRRIDSILSPSIEDRYGINALKEVILASERFINNKRKKKKKVNKNRKGSFLVSLSRKLVDKKRERKSKTDKLFSEFWKTHQERYDPIKLSSRLKEIDIQIDGLSKKVQWHKEEIQMRKEMIFETEKYEPHLSEKPKYTPSILYDKEPPYFKEGKRKAQNQGKLKRKPSNVTLKICIFGGKRVGIATLLQTFDHLLELESYMLRSFGFGVKSIRLEGITFKLQIWFLNTHRLFKKRYSRFPPSFELLIRGSNGAFLVYDITNIESLKRIPEWIHSLREINGDIPILLLGNKCDLESLREISKEERINFVKKYNLSGSYEISVKTGKNVDLPFQKISELWLQKYVELEKEYDR